MRLENGKVKYTKELYRLGQNSNLFFYIERHLRDLENTIRTLREQRNSTAKELKKTKNRLEVYKTENWYLKGVMLTLQFMCMHHNIDLPPHTPYLAEEALVEMGKTHPHAIEAYVNAYTRNNINLKPNLTAHFANLSASDHNNKNNSSSKDGKGSTDNIGTPSTPSLDHLSLDNNNTMASSSESISSPPPLIPPPDDMDHLMSTTGNEDDMQQQQQIHLGHDDRASTPLSVSTAPVFEHEDVARWTMDDAEEDDDDDEKDAIIAATSSMGAIQRIRLQLRVQSTLSTISGDHLPSVRLQPTLLQLAIAHDPRIDLIPAPQMRDRMIIFRDLLNYDEVFTLLLNGAVYHGGDPTLSQSWELPATFHSEYWFLSSRYDLDTTNRWRRLKSLPEIPPGGPDRRWTPPPGLASPQQKQHDSSPSCQMDGHSSWSDTVHSPDASTYLVSSPQQPASYALAPRQSKHPLYDKVLGSPPEMRHPVTSPTLGKPR